MMATMTPPRKPVDQRAAEILADAVARLDREGLVSSALIHAAQEAAEQGDDELVIALSDQVVAIGDRIRLHQRLTEARDRAFYEVLPVTLPAGAAP